MQEFEMIPDWQLQRSDFVHRWGKLSFIDDIELWENIMRGLVVDAEFEAKFPEALAKEFDAYRNEAQHLIEGFEAEMSPRAAWARLGRSKLNDSPQWLGEIAHALWLSRVPVQALVRDAENCLRGADEAYAGFIVVILSGRTEARRRKQAGIRSAEAFRLRCRGLRTMIATFPSRTLFT